MSESFVGEYSVSAFLGDLTRQDLRRVVDIYPVGHLGKESAIVFKGEPPIRLEGLPYSKLVSDLQLKFGGAALKCAIAGRIYPQEEIRSAETCDYDVLECA